MKQSDDMKGSMEALKSQYSQYESEMIRCGREIAQLLLEQRAAEDGYDTITENLTDYLSYMQAPVITADIYNDTEHSFDICLETTDKDYPEDLIAKFLSFYGDVECKCTDGTTNGFHLTYTVTQHSAVNDVSSNLRHMAYDGRF